VVEEEEPIVVEEHRVEKEERRVGDKIPTSS